MIAWPDFEVGFAALLQTLSGVPVNVANARDNGLAFTFPAGAPYPEPGTTDLGQVSLNFSVLSEATWGRDEHRETYDPNTPPPGDTYAGPGAPLGSIIESVNGNRELTIQVTCDRFDQTSPAFATLQRVRDRLWLPSARAACKALGIAVSKSRPIMRVEGDLDGRAVSRYVFEIVANTMSNAEDSPITTIERVNAGTSAT